jgi:tetratricopeptide (TPR) repeat protein
MVSQQTFPASFGELLKSFRKRKRLTQKQVAQHLSVHANTISSWELGTYLPATHGLVLELARHLALDELETRRLLEASLTALSPHWQVIFPRNPFFTGREEILEILYKHLHTEQVVALTQSYALFGLGGIGKTQIALEYAYRHALEYSAVFWIEAETVEYIVSSMLRIAELLQLPERQESDQQRIVTAVQSWLSTHSRWLLIWDNLEDLELLHRFLPSARQGAILITTRCQTLGTLALGLELSPMGREEGMLFLLRRAKVLEPEAASEQIQQFAQQLPTEYAAAEQLITAMDGLPLALDQAGAYIEETRCSFSSYLRSFEQQIHEFLDRRGALGVDHPHSVIATLGLACQRASERDPSALDLLHFCALVSPDAIPERLLLMGVSQPGLVLDPVAANSDQLDQSIAALRSLSLVQRHPETQTLSLHRLVQTVLRELMSEQERSVWMRRVTAVLNRAFPEASYEAWRQCERLLPHVLACAVATSDQSRNQDLGEVMRKAADYLRERARYDQAELLYKRALLIWEQRGESAHREAIHSLNGLARLSFLRAQFETSKALYQRALQLGKQTLGPESLEVAFSLNGLGIIYEMLGELEQAEPLLQQALTIRKQIHGPEHLELAYSFYNVAMLSAKQGKEEQAESLYQQALCITVQSLEPEHPFQAYPLYGLALLYAEQGKDEQAEALYQQALYIDEQALGPAHPEVAYPLNNLAKLYMEQSKYEEAEPLYQRALYIWEQALGPEHPEIANALENLAELNVRQEKHEQAELYLHRACTIFEQHLGQTHPETVRARSIYQNLLEQLKIRRGSLHGRP